MNTKPINNELLKHLKKPELISILVIISLIFTRFYMLGIDIVNRDSFHFKNWSYVFMKEFESHHWDKLFVAIQPGMLTIYSNIIGFKTLYFFKDKLHVVTAVGKEFELLLHIFQKIPQSSFIVILSVISFFLIYKLFNLKIALLFALIYIFEHTFIIYSRFIQTDALQSILIFCSLLFLFYWDKTQKNIHFIISGIFAGLAFIEKSSSIALIPFIGLALVILKVRGVGDFKNIKLYLNPVKKLVLFVALFFATAFVFFPYYWFHPVQAFLRMTLDAFIHGVEGVMLDSYDFQRPDTLAIPSFKPDFSLLNYFYYHQTEIFLMGIGLFALLSIYLFLKKRKFDKKILLLFLFAFYYFLIVSISNLRMERYMIVSAIPLALVSAYGINLFADFFKSRKIFVYLVFSALIFVLGLYVYFFYAPDWGAYSNLVARSIKKDSVYVG